MGGAETRGTPDPESLVSAAGRGKSPFLPTVPGHQPRCRVGETQAHPPQAALHLIVSLRGGPQGLRVQPRARRRPPTSQPPAGRGPTGPGPGPGPSRDPAPGSAARTAPGWRGRAPGKWRRERRQRLRAPRPAGPEGEAEYSPRQQLSPPAGLTPGAAPGSVAAARARPAAAAAAAAASSAGAALPLPRRLERPQLRAARSVTD